MATNREQIDAVFAGMAADNAYQAEAEAIAREFELASWEALEIAEQEMAG